MSNIKNSINGVLPMIKPPGPSSQDLVTDVKRALGIKKAGHAGTLDPAAAGILPVCVGKATRLFDYLIDKDKSYRCEIELGICTDTLDTYGKRTEVETDVNITSEQFGEALKGFLGDVMQKPPLYSALKLKGKKLYQIARSGASVEIQEEIRNKKQRTITINSIELVSQSDTTKFVFDVDCSKGTYIRVLCEDIAKSLGTVGYMSFLLRTKSAGLDVSSGITIDELRIAIERDEISEYIIPMDKAIDHIPAIYLGDEFNKYVLNGRKTPVEYENCDAVRIYCADKFMGIGTVEDNILSIKSLLI